MSCSNDICAKHCSNLTRGRIWSNIKPRRAQIVIDVQNEYITGKFLIEHPPVASFLSNIIKATDAAKQHNIPVVAVQQIMPEDFPIFARGSAGAYLHPLVSIL
jgi:nicotinamidase-related amidase